MRGLLIFLSFTVALFAIPADIEVYFSPDGGCQQAIVDAITESDSSIDVAIYTFTEGDIAKALVAAKDRGVKIRVVMDGENVNGTYSKATFLANAGIPVRYETKSGLMHDKFAVVDGQKVITGSFNWTASAEASNYENLLVILSPPLAAEYETDFQGIWSEAVAFASSGTSPPESSSVGTIPATPQTQQTDDYTVYITKSGSKYHSAGCSYLRSSSIPILKSKAIAQGYTPCSRCNP